MINNVATYTSIIVHNAQKNTHMAEHVCITGLLRNGDLRDVFYLLSLKTGAGGQEVDGTEENNNNNKGHGGVYHQLLAFFTRLVTRTTGDKVLEHSPNKHQKTDTYNERNKHFVAKCKDIS